MNTCRPYEPDDAPLSYLLGHPDFAHTEATVHDSCAPPFERAHPTVQAFYGRDTYEQIRARAKERLHDVPPHARRGLQRDRRRGCGRFRRPVDLVGSPHAVRAGLRHRWLGLLHLGGVEQMSRDPWPLNTWLTRHPKTALLLLAAVLLLQMGADGLLEKL